MADAEDNLDGLPEEAIDPTKEPKSSKAWLAVITHAEKEFRDYQDRADNIDKHYANLDRLASVTRDRQFQMFWANIQVLAPSIYSRPPVPVVVPRFKDRRPLYQKTSELLERAVAVAFEIEDVDAVMRQVRDDLVTLARGCIWVRYDTREGEDRVCIEHADRKDFLHDPARTWKEVDWVAKRSWLTKREMRKRFRKTSGDAYKDAAYAVRKDDDADGGKLKAGVWELWSKSQDKVVWISEGVDKTLDEDAPHLKLEGFFPCPRPAYGTVQRRTLVPVPDFVFYKDQLEEINELTARIAALTEAVRLRGFYPAGAGEIGDAVEAAVKSQADNVVLIPISNWSLLGTGSVSDMIVWLPLDMVVAAIKELVGVRTQLIDDVYQITGLSDIMRGSTEASETLGAQQLKSQYGSIRIRDRQDELIRVARDVTRITAEIMAENFEKQTLLDMSQMEIRTDAEVSKEAKPLDAQLKAVAEFMRHAQSDPQVQQMAKAKPEQAQQIIQGKQQEAQQVQAQIEKLKDEPTIEKVIEFLRDQRLRPFVLDIETDSTIAPDENAQKQRATEYMTAMGGLIAQAMPVLQAFPEAAAIVADTIRFAQSQFRVGRQMDQTVEEFVEKMKALAGQPKPPDPNAIKAQADAKAVEADAQAKTAEAQSRGQEAQVALAERAQALQEKQATFQLETDKKMALGQIEIGLAQSKASQAAEQHGQAMRIGSLQIEKLGLEIEGVRTKTAATLATTHASIEATEAKTNAGIAATEAGIEAKRESAMQTEDA